MPSYEFRAYDFMNQNFFSLEVGRRMCQGWITKDGSRGWIYEWCQKTVKCNVYLRTEEEVGKWKFT